MKTVQFNAGDVIISEGEEGNSAFLIINGSVEVIVGEGKKAKTVATLKDGDVFGEMSLLEPGPRSATVKALTNTECTMTSYDDFMASIQDSPEQAINFMKTLVLRLRQMNEVMANMGPNRRRLRDVFKDWQIDAELADAAERERWENMSEEERRVQNETPLYMGIW